MKKDKSTLIIIIILVFIVIIGYFVFGIKDDNDDKFKNLIVETKSGIKIQTEYSSLKNEKFFIKVPTSFKEMSLEDKQQIFINEIPDKVYVNEDKSINIVLDITEEKISNDDILKKYKGYEINKIDNHNIALVVKKDDNKDYHTLYFSYNGFLSKISFDSLLSVYDEWESVQNFVLESLYFN